MPDYLTNVSLGFISGASIIFGLGNNPNINTNSVPEDIWSGGGTYTWLSSAGNPFWRSVSPMIPLQEKTDFIFRCTSVSVNSTDLTASFIGVLQNKGIV